MKKKIKAFTLVELLAVVVILAVILVIAVPKIMKTIEQSRKTAMESSAKMVAAAAHDIRPAVFLKSTVNVVSGSGTSTDPYILN